MVRSIFFLLFIYLFICCFCTTSSEEILKIGRRILVAATLLFFFFGFHSFTLGFLRVIALYLHPAPRIMWNMPAKTVIIVLMTDR